MSTSVELCVSFLSPQHLISRLLIQWWEVSVIWPESRMSSNFPAEQHNNDQKTKNGVALPFFFFFKSPLLIIFNQLSVQNSWGTAYFQIKKVNDL